MFPRDVVLEGLMLFIVGLVILIGGVTLSYLLISWLIGVLLKLGGY